MSDTDINAKNAALLGFIAHLSTHGHKLPWLTLDRMFADGGYPRTPRRDRSQDAGRPAGPPTCAPVGLEGLGRREGRPLNQE